MALWKIEIDGRERLCSGSVSDGPTWLLDEALTVTDLLVGERGTFAQKITSAVVAQAPSNPDLLLPLDSQEVWAAGVTYSRSMVARNEESAGGDHYDRVYEASRPELFLKASPFRSRGPGQTIGIRSDSSWDVPEPELALVVDRHGDIVAYTMGNDVSSRSIEGENPLYLPQAKVYGWSCSLGPCLVPVEEAPSLEMMEVRLTIARGGSVAFDSSVAVSEMKRTTEDLVHWLRFANDFPVGVALLTGTGIVPDTDFTLAAGDTVSVSITGLGVLTNHVVTVGQQS